ncbi:hypothetical protein DQ384_26675 [Sphaerisporangium album]|uniref:Gram-positive cocci surface proteins LPxTG domain-containing protein n=1 Tax=Sphaerisporangium album TaxID=509200 RepID=A0A367FCI8_9ACTN|nr:hypothetical protein [Sphaerisporangium album]RCG27300.1 hypothetical protein DQ384_26675 [Sphaerisporangium album]
MMGRRFTPFLLGVEPAIALVFCAGLATSPAEPAPAPERTPSSSTEVSVRVLPPKGDPPPSGREPATPVDPKGGPAGVVAVEEPAGESGGGVTVSGGGTFEYTEGANDSHGGGEDSRAGHGTGPAGAEQPGGVSTGGTAPVQPGAPARPGGPAPGRLPFTGADPATLVITLVGGAATLLGGAVLIRLATRRRRPRP